MTRLTQETNVARIVVGSVGEAVEQQLDYLWFARISGPSVASKVRDGLHVWDFSTLINTLDEEIEMYYMSELKSIDYQGRYDI